MTLRHHGFGTRYLTLFAGEVISKACVFLAFAYLARTLPPAGFGAVELALAAVTILLLAVETGFGSYGAKAASISPEHVPGLIAQVGLIRLLLASLAYAVILGMTAWYPAVSRHLLAIYGLTLFLSVFNIQWVFQGLRQMQWVAAGNLLRYATFAALVVVLVSDGGDVRMVGVAEVGGAALLAGFNITVLVTRLPFRPQFSGIWGGAAAVFRRTWFLGASDLAWSAMWYAPVLVLGALSAGGIRDVAWLAASLRMVMAIHAFVWLYFFNMVSTLSRAWHDGPAHWRDLMERSMPLAMWAGCAIALAGTLLAPVLVRIAYGPDFSSAAVPFQIGVWMIPLAWFSGHHRFSLIVGGHERTALSTSAAGAVVAALAAVPAAWAGSAAGAALALLAGGVVNAVAAAVATGRTMGAVRLRHAAPAIVATLGSAALALGLGRISSDMVAAAAAFAVFGLAMATSLDRSAVRRAWRSLPELPPRPE